MHSVTAYLEAIQMALEHFDSALRPLDKWRNFIEDVKGIMIIEK